MGPLRTVAGLPTQGKSYVGRSGEEGAEQSCLVKDLEELFGGRVDVQLGSGYLN